jgi:ESF2/ABP1 family protein
MARDEGNKYPEPDADESDDDQSRRYDSEEEEEFQKGGRSAKRRRVNIEEPSEDDLSEEEDDEFDDEEAQIKPSPAPQPVEASTEEQQEHTSRPETPKPLKKKNLIATEEAIRKSGVVYLSQIPPFMKPQKLRQLLEPHGKLNRIYLAEEEASARTRRLKSGGNRRRLYTEGWVEFVKKKEAKRTCELLNARNIGGKKRSRWHDSIWTLLYLKGFKWHHLTEQVAAERAARENMMRAEISKATRENREFARNVERAKMLDGMQAKRKRKRDREGGGAAEEEGSVVETETSRTFKQKVVVKRDGGAGGKPSEHKTKVLGDIF